MKPSLERDRVTKGRARMLRRAHFQIGIFSAAVLTIIGCGGGPAVKKDGGPDSSGTAGTTVVDGGAGTTGSAGTGTAGSGTGGAAGAANPTGSSIFIGDQAILLDLGPACTNEEGATADRWCAFIAASVSAPGNGDLFVFNASKAAAGTAITCGLTDP